jgi:hypothetical protein
MPVPIISGSPAENLCGAAVAVYTERSRSALLFFRNIIELFRLGNTISSLQTLTIPYPSIHLTLHSKFKQMNKTYCWKCVMMLASILGMIGAFSA